MIVGISLQTFTTIHVMISLAAIASGLVVLFGMLGSHKLGFWTAFFLFTTILTSVTGFMFPIRGFTPALAVGGLSLVILTVTVLARYAEHLAGAWRWIFVVTAVTALWFNVFVLIVQSFQKVAFLQPLAPTQSEPPFLITQTVVLAIFVVLGAMAAIKFRPALVHHT
jgi:hypothetical protein